MKSKPSYKSNELTPKKDKGFAFSVFVLTFSTFLVKIIGLAYKIPMMSLLGAEGMGYFNSAYEIYALLCVISTSGLPIALSMLVSSDNERGDIKGLDKTYKTAMSTFLAIGFSGTFLMLAFAKKTSEFIENDGAYLSLLAIAPVLIFVCISSAVRGYFQGLCKMTPTAVSQIIEAVGKLVLGVCFAKAALSKGYPVYVASCAGIVGLGVGAMLSSVYLVLLKFSYSYRKKDSQEYRQKTSVHCRNRKSEIKQNTLKTLFKIALPITLSSAMLGFTKIADMTLIMKRLQDIGYTSVGANVIYGSYTTLAIPVFSLIPSLVAPVSLALVPRLSAAIERKSLIIQSKVCASAMRITVFLAMPGAMGISLYSKDILSILFADEKEAVELVSPLLSILAVSVLFSCIITTSNAILHSYRQTAKPIISIASGCVVKIVSEYVLMGIKGIEIYGAPISTLLCDMTVAFLNIYFMNKYVPQKESIKTLCLKPFASSVFMIFMSYGVYRAVIYLSKNSIMGFFVAVAVGVISYFWSAFLFGSVTKEDIESLPHSDKILLVLEKIGFFKSKTNKLTENNKN